MYIWKNTDVLQHIFCLSCCNHTLIICICPSPQSRLSSDPHQTGSLNCWVSIAKERSLLQKSPTWGFLLQKSPTWGSLLQRSPTWPSSDPHVGLLCTKDPQMDGSLLQKSPTKTELFLIRDIILMCISSSFTRFFQHTPVPPASYGGWL